MGIVSSVRKLLWRDAERVTKIMIEAGSKNDPIIKFQMHFSNENQIEE